jgi:MFS family permease
LQSEVRSVVSLSILYAIRMLGLFMVLPILAIYGADLDGASPAKLGLALGIYGLTQAFFQIPLGMLSDVIGRKPIIVLGLVVFAVGSYVAANSDTVFGLIIGRALQGSGAIASTIMALISDLTSEKNRTKAMASIGASIGLSFSLAIIIGPSVAGSFGLSGVFYLSVFLAFIGILIALFVVPSPEKSSAHREVRAAPELFKSMLQHAQLRRLYVGIGCLHASLTALFTVIPVNLLRDYGMPQSDHWQVYLPVMVIAFLLAVPAIVAAERKGKGKEVFVAAIAVLFISLVLFAFLDGFYLFLVALFIYFVAFNALEAMLPSLVSKISPAGSKGTAMGLYSSSQFFGAFIGGALGGLILQYWGKTEMFLFSAGLSWIWLIYASTMTRARPLKSICYPVNSGLDSYDLDHVAGVEESFYSEEDRIVYLKVDSVRLDNTALEEAILKFQA